MTPPPPITRRAVTGGKVDETQQPKKRGFWGRLFGRGDNDKDKKQKKPGGGGG